ncbi:MAG TPA: hypothetical protein VH255_10065, partial [Verrucomicrobiae bacterium]|nr:hypothetical protein [Verrucomicrobiae bacterium]
MASAVASGKDRHSIPMNEQSAFGLGRWLNHRWRRLLIVVIGIVAGQCVLYGPSLVGKKILLPLDILVQPTFYLPMTPETSQMVPQDHIVLDLVTQWEPARQQAGEEFRAGRLPMWTPYQ